MEGILIVISGFSGAGKGTLMKRLISDYDDYALSVSMTTRAPRDGEVNGREYFFVSKEEFESAINNNKLIEHASYCDNYYGTPKDYVDSMLKAGKNVILEIEVQGAMQIKEKFPETLLLFVTPPSIAELEKRLRQRGTEDEAIIAKRLSQAKRESLSIEKYDYLVINDDLDDAVKRMNNIIMAAKYDTLRQDEKINELRSDIQNLSI